MSKRESVATFCKKFDEIVNEYEGCEGAIKLTDEEKRSAFLQAVNTVIPEVTSHSITYQQSNKRVISLKEIKDFVLQIEAMKNAVKKSDERVEGAHNVRVTRSNNCNRCSEYGHWEYEYQMPSHLWKCFKCNSVHTKGGSCQTQTEERYVKTQNYNSDENKRSGRGMYRGKPYGKFNNKRGNARGNFRGKRGSLRGRVNKRVGESIKSNKVKKIALAAAQAVLAEHNKEQQNKGKDSNKYFKENKISFLADSGATEHIVNKSLALSNFKKSTGGIIKSANKNKSADIEIDGIGDLYLKSNNNKIKLTNILAAENISENLISLRRFADLGLGIYLDNEKLEIFDKITNEIYLLGNYEKPNWRLNFSVKEKENENFEYTAYTCTANIISESDFTEQSQSVSRDLKEGEKETEGEKENTSNVLILSRIGRENENSKIRENTENIDFDIDTQTIKRKIWNLDLLENIEEFENIKSLELKSENNKEEKLDKGMLWHIRLGHPNLQYLKYLKSSNEYFKEIEFKENILECEICKFAKMEKLPFRETRTLADRPLHTIHTDIMGKFKLNSFPGSFQYMIVFIDDYSRFAKIYSIKNKSEAASSLESFIDTTRNLIGKNEKVCYLRTDNAREFTGGEFKEIMEREKIEGDYAPPYTPELNGTAERFNKTIQQKIRALLIDSGLPESMWALAAETAINVYNRTPHKRIKFDTPLNKLNPRLKTHLDKIKRFGCVAYAYLPKTESKFTKRAIRTILVGYSRTGYILWEPTTNKFVTSRNVTFNEKLVYKNIYKIKESEKIINPDLQAIEINSEVNIREIEENIQPNENPEPQIQVENKPKRGRPKKRKIEENEIQTTNENKKTRVIERKHKPKRDDMFVYSAELNKEKTFNVSQEERHIMLATINKDPANYREAMKSENCDLWKEAIETEKQSIEKNNVFDIINRPEDINVLDSRWIFSKKVIQEGRVLYKARLVIRGYQDDNEYELREIYAPVSRLPLVRTCLSIINKENLEARQSDVKTAFLNGELKIPVYMEIPEGFESSEKEREKKVWKLRKALYGLPVSPKRWFEKFKEEILKLGLENDIHDPSLFTWRREGKMVFVLLYVDDMITAGNDEEKLNEVTNHLKRVFEVKDLGEPDNFLGMRIKRDRANREMSITQSEYINKMLEKFNMKECNPQETPMVTRQVRKRDLKGKENAKELQKLRALTKAPYREAIGSLMYLSSTTRPDIAYAVNYLARKQQSPSELDWQEAKRVFRYLRGTSELGLIYKSEGEELEAWTDSSFRDLERSDSTGGYVIKFHGDTIAWRSQKQNYPSLSTCQSEYLAASSVSKEIIALDKPIRDIVGKSMYPVTVKCDNLAAGKCTQMEGSHKLKDFDYEIKEINERLREREETGKKPPMADSHGDFVKYCVSKGRIRVNWVSTIDNIADIMTKPLPAPSHLKLRDKLLN